MMKNNKKVLVWSTEISVGEEAIDTQHKDLLKQMGVLAFSLKTGEGNEKIQEILNFLDEYIKTHLRYEEKYMLNNNYPEYESHRKLHENFEKKFRDFKVEFYKENMDKKSLALKMEGYMRDWWINHISNDDKKYADFITNKEK